MIKPVECYTAICDGCGVNICEDTGYSGWCNDGINNAIDDCDWLKIDDTENKTFKIYCPDCYSYDDDDNLILKTKNVTNDNRNEV